MKYFKLCFWSVVCLFLVSAVSVAAPVYEADNSVVAVVGNRVITADELRMAIMPMVRSIQASARNQQDFNDKIDVVMQETLQNLVDRLIVLIDSEKKGMKVPDDYVEEQYNDHIREYFNGDRMKFLEFLRSQGMTTRDFKEQLKEKIIFESRRSEIRRLIPQVSPEKVFEYYEQHQDDFTDTQSFKMREIVLKPVGSETLADMRKKAEGIKERIDKGERFYDIEKSMNPRAVAPENLAWKKPEDYIAALADAAIKLKKGETSDPIEFSGMIILLHAEDVRGAGTRPLEEVGGEIEERLASEYAREAEREWLDVLRKSIYHKILQ